MQARYLETHSKKSKIMGTTIIILSFVAMVPASELLLNVSENSKAALAVREESTYKFNVFNQSKTADAHDAKKWRTRLASPQCVFNLGSLQKRRTMVHSPTRRLNSDDGSTLYQADEENHLRSTKTESSSSDLTRRLRHLCHAT